MNTTKKISREEMIERVESPDYDAFAHGEFESVVGPRYAGPAPISVRLSKPLLERLDRLAGEQHRSRSNLIQHVLWAYVHDEAE